MKLSDEQLDEVLASIASKDGIERQAARICRLLSTGAYRTGAVAHRCSVGNLSDVVTAAINPKISHLGLFIGCVKPPRTLRNKFDQKCGDWLYSFYTTDIAANDDDYGQGSSADDWMKELAVVIDDDDELDLSALDHLELDVSSLEDQPSLEQLDGLVLSDHDLDKVGVK